MTSHRTDQSATRTIRWGVVGCGDVVRKRVASAIRETPGSSLIAASRRDAARLAEFCQTMSVARAYSDAAELMSDPDVDAVYIATPVRLHLPHAEMAAAAGKHVLVEKPMAMTIDECDRMIGACEAAGVCLGVAYYRRFYPLIERVEELLRQTAIGTTLGVSAVTATPLAVRAGEEGFWRNHVAEGGGGSLMDIGSHRINLFLHLFGEIAEVKSICARVVGSRDADDPGDVEDAAVVLMRFANAMVGTLQCHFGADDPDEFSIVGTRGRLVARPLNGDRLMIEIDGKQTTEILPPPSNLCAPLIADFAEAVRQSRRPRVDGQEARETNRVMAMAYADSPGFAAR